MPTPVRRALVAACSLALAAPAAALAQTGPVQALPPAKPPAVTEIAPGIGYQRMVRPGGEVVHVIRAAATQRVGLRPAMPGGSPSARGLLTDAVARGADAGAVAGVNGDFFTASTNDPSGVLVIDGDLIHEPEASRSALAITPAGLAAAVMTLQGRYQAVDPSGAVRYTTRTFGGVNRPAKRSSETILYTPSYGQAATPTAGSRYEVKVRWDQPGPLAPNVARTGTVVGAQSGGGMAIPSDGAVLTAVGSAGPNLVSDLPMGQKVTITPGVLGLPADALSAIGGGPLLVRDGTALTSFGEGFTSGQLGSRTARTAVGQRADGTALLVTVEGPQQGTRGVTTVELAQLMRDLGASTAIAMDAGGSAQLALWNRLQTPWSAPRTLADVLLVTYQGVTMQPLPFRLSPNADRVDDRAVAVVHSTQPGNVRVTIAGRTGRPAKRLWEGRLGPGAVPVGVDPRKLGLGDGIYYVVAKSEPADGGAPSEQKRRIVIDRTLSSLATRPSAKPSPRVVVTYRLARAARVTVRIRSTSGSVLRTLRANALQRPGRGGVVWDRTAGGKTVSGTLQVTVEVRSRYGTTGLVRTFSVKAPPKPATPRP
ncbi:MAG: phosphodiester glycosidase family protein [Thermoleophilia bacterium]